MVKINFQGVEANRIFDPIPAGMYEHEFSSYKFGKTSQQSKNPGEDKVDLTFSVTGNVPGEEEFKGRKNFRTCTFSADSLWAFKRTMQALGSTVDWEDEDGIDPDAVCREVLHHLCQIKVSIEDYEAVDPITRKTVTKSRNRIDDVLPTDETFAALQAAAAEPVTSGGRNHK